MTVNVGQPTHTLQISRVIPATPRQVFDAWTDAAILANWLAPERGFTTIVHELELRVGGRYRIEMRSPAGEPNTAIGVYREIVPGSRLSFTWKWAERAEMEDTLVTLDFMPHGADTELVLTHALFRSADARDHHEKGWNGCIARLLELQERAV